MAKKGIFAAFAALLGLGCGADAETVSRAEAMVQEGAILLDVRTPGEFQGGHIEGARNIPVQELSARLGELEEGADVVVYCRSGARSARAAGMLRERGHEVLDLGAMSSWPNADEIVR
ncbi:MAG TPA: rhodanese-like domain-containing protein [Polyangiaceae bacterium LLY-WYZ-15_(1-7)]|nr:rhodanese-like domain-containing protein [Polyangiaceae bacterium LLY-WYZ-15_(1-7)]HJL04482.1 rhodanese-like domain-containing protein [Polyangiaceae bacterium LLY-WYZ-15_(1-7)]HJL08434.1 rhodanese-like domain-containing protein [Polyangiaceae bacterium LLY-WYZ-15_(1-7)]HJL22785.1 rhodanese-like domain-containing protein [Polyangiaceae bacterium LLY-WYZ-15_(1-7)]HJL27691.1 rhodanese-like domain-containing protein [Polyangiaceae bacterium LLY-WYZ-15_(1-7)]